MQACLRKLKGSIPPPFPGSLLILPLITPGWEMTGLTCNQPEAKKMLLSPNCRSHTTDLNPKPEFKTDLEFEGNPQTCSKWTHFMSLQRNQKPSSSLRCQAKGREPFSFPAGANISWGRAAGWEHHLSLPCPPSWPLGALSAPAFFQAVHLGGLQWNGKECHCSNCSHFSTLNGQEKNSLLFDLFSSLKKKKVVSANRFRRWL